MRVVASQRSGDTATAPGPSLATVAVLLVAVVIGAALRLEHVSNIGSRTPDERVYAANAQRVALGGLDELPVMMREYNRNRTLWLYPPPWRIGYLLPLAGAMKLTGNLTEQVGSWLSFAASIVSLVSIAVVAIRFLDLWAAVYSVLCLALAFPELTIARRCWADAPFGAIALLLVWMACEITRNPHRRWCYILFVGIGSYTILVKELGPVIFAACATYVLTILIGRRLWRAALGLCLCGFVGTGLALYALVLSAGGLSPLFAGWQHINAGFRMNDYSREYQSGPWLLFIQAFCMVNPANFVLAALSIGLCFLPIHRSTRWKVGFNALELSVLRFWSCLSVLLVLVVLMLPIAQNLRFLSPIHGPACLLGGAMFSAILRFGRRLNGFAQYLVAVGAAAAVLGGTIAGYHRFESGWASERFSDLSIKMVLDSRYSQLD